MVQMTYEEYRTARQSEFNKLPLFFAFSNKQFKEEMEKRGLTENDTQEVYRLAAGSFYLRKDAEVIREYFNRPDSIKDLMKDYNFAKDAILYEMQNHEYHINWQGDWDVCSCFGDVTYTDADNELECYFNELEWEEQTRQAYRDARREMYRLAEENDLY